jgi:hypothetical protein
MLGGSAATVSWGSSDWGVPTLLRVDTVVLAMEKTGESVEVRFDCIEAGGGSVE